MPIPVVISENGLGVPVTPVDGRAPVAVVAANGRGLPIVIAANATPMVIIGSNIRGTWPVLASLANGDTLSSAVTWGTYSSPVGPVSTAKEMQVDGGAWLPYNAGATVSGGEVWRVREIADDTFATRTFTSAAQEVEAVPAAAPAITSVVFDGEAEPMTLSFSVDRDCTVYWAWVDSSVAKSGADLFDIVDQDDAEFIHGSIPMATGINYPTIEDQPTGSGEYWLQFVAKADGLYSTVQVVGPVAAIQVGMQFTETWSDFSEDDDFSDLTSSGRYSGSGIVAKVVSDIDGPDGKRLNFRISQNNAYTMSIPSVNEYLSSKDWSTLECVGLLRTGSNDVGGRGWIGFSANAGNNIYGVATDSSKIGLMLAGSDNPLQWSWIQVIRPASVDEAVVWFRLKFYDGNKLSLSMWTGDYDDEPESWDKTDTHDTAWAEFMDSFQIVGRLLSGSSPNYKDIWRFLGLWVAVDRDVEVTPW